MKLTAYHKYRFLEIIPGIIVWMMIVVVLVLSFIKPLWLIFFAIVFDFYWLMRVFYFIIYLFLSWREYRRQSRVDWLKEVQSHQNWQRLKHIIFLPTVDEDISVLRQTLNGIKNSTYPLKQMVIVLAGEERQQKHFNQVAPQLTHEYGGLFLNFIVTLHPANLPGEIPAKGANINWAGHQVQKFVDAQKWSYDDIIVSSFDIDTVVHPQYFSYLTNTFLNHPRPTRSSYQPIALYNNNIWAAPSFARVVANSTTFWLMAELARPRPLWTFSSHSMSWRALVDVGFWQNDIVTEDSRIFLQCFIHYNGDYEVTPLYIPVSMDTAHAGGLGMTIQNLYKQQRRWAWGIEHFPFMIWHFWRNPAIKGKKKWQLVFNLTEGMVSWATAPLLILILGYLPLLLIGEVDKTTVIVQKAPHVLEWLMRIAMIGIFVSAILNVFLLPTIHKHRHWLKIIVMLGQWILLPITLIIFGSFPAIDAQTHLMLGRYLGFYTTKKVKKLEGVDNAGSRV